MKLVIKKATSADIDEIALLYDCVNDKLEGAEENPGWSKGEYPIREDAELALIENILFVAYSDSRLVGTFILAHTPHEDAFYTENWEQLPKEKTYIICTLAIHPDFQHCGAATQMLNFIEIYARENNISALRLSVYSKNTPAIKLYRKLGYVCADTVDLGYSDYGLNFFDLYEKRL